MKLAKQRAKVDGVADDGGYPPLTRKQLAHIAKCAAGSLPRGRVLSSESLFDQLDTAAVDTACSNDGADVREHAALVRGAFDC